MDFMGGAGGAGGAGNTLPQAGEFVVAAQGRSGGGGGAVGRIRINVGPGAQPNLTGAIVSPVATVGQVSVPQ
jgi:hypothetical protein